MSTLLANSYNVTMKKISLCMIVRNESSCLENCLKSAKDCVDEIIIVDTGSTDNTVEIAKKFTEKVYFFEWQNDFSLALYRFLRGLNLVVKRTITGNTIELTIQ